MSTTPTAARPKPSNGGGHWYAWDGSPQYEIMGKTTGKPRPVTLRDARANNWVPGVTTILKVLHKEALVNWMCEQAALAVLTTPRAQDEQLDVFVHRVLHEEEQQHQEAQIARDKGLEIHAAIEDYFNGKAIEEGIKPWVMPAIEAIIAFGPKASSEMILVGSAGYGGRTDLVQDCDACWRLWDYKSSKNLPDPARGGAWAEHRLQLSAYGKALQEKLKAAGELKKPIITGNVYISTVTPGQFVICEHEDWEGTYHDGFAPLVKYWQWSTGYAPKNPKAPIDIPQPHTLAQAAAQESVDVANMRAHYIAANARVEELEKRLNASGPIIQSVSIDAEALLEHLKDPGFRARAAAAGWDVKELKAAAEKATAEPQAAPVPGAMPTNTNLPTHDKEGRKLSWTVATAQAPATPRK